MWARRQAHETAIHRVDGESALGALSGTPFEPSFGADGVDELLALLRAPPQDGAHRRPSRRCCASRPSTPTATGTSWSVRSGVTTQPGGTNRGRRDGARRGVRPLPGPLEPSRLGAARRHRRPRPPRAVPRQGPRHLGVRGRSTLPCMRTRLTELLDIEHPVMLAGMGGVSYHRLVAAVSEAGGIGTLGASTMGDELAGEMAEVRELTDKPFGVDLLTAMPGPGRARHPDGDRRRRPHLRRRPRRAPRGRSTCCTTTTSSSAACAARCATPSPRSPAACDFVVAQGTEAGGHTGHGRHDGARAAGRRRRRRPGARRRRRRPVRRARAWRPRSRSAPTACGSAPASSPRPRPAPSTATRRRCCATAEDGTVDQPRVHRQDLPRRAQRVDQPLRGAPRGAAAVPRPGDRRRPRPAPTTSAHPTAPTVDLDREFMPCGQGVGAIDELVPAGELVRADGRPRPSAPIDRRASGTRACDDGTETDLAIADDRPRLGRRHPARRCTSTSRIPNVSRPSTRRGSEHGHMDRAVELIRDWCAARPIAGLTVEVHELPGPHAADRHARSRRSDRGARRRHRAAVRPPRQAAGDDRLARRPRPVDAGHRGRPAVRPRRRRRRLRRVRRRSLAIEAAQAERHAPRPLRRADRGQRGERQPRPARPTSRRWPTASARPSLVLCLDSRVPRLRAAVGHDVAARAGRRRRSRVEILDRGRALAARPAASCRRSFRIIRELLDRDRGQRRPATMLLPELHVEIPADRRRRGRRHRGRPFPVADDFPFAGGDAADGRRPGRAAAGHDVAPDAQRHRRRRHPADRAAGNVLRPYTSLHAQLPPAADVRSRRPPPRRSSAALTDRPAVRRAPSRSTTARLGAGLERPAVRAVAAGRARRGVDDDLRQAGARRSARAASIPFMGMLGACSPTPSSSSPASSGRAATPTGPTSTCTCRRPAGSPSASPACSAPTPRRRRPDRRRPRRLSRRRAARRARASWRSPPSRVADRPGISASASSSATASC